MKTIAKITKRKALIKRIICIITAVLFSVGLILGFVFTSLSNNTSVVSADSSVLSDTNTTESLDDFSVIVLDSNFVGSDFTLNQIQGVFLSGTLNSYPIRLITFSTAGNKLTITYTFQNHTQLVAYENGWQYEKVNLLFVANVQTDDARQWLLEHSSLYPNSNYSDGAKFGYEMGFEEGKQNGIQQGYENGYNTGKQDGFGQGYNDGYNTGKQDGIIEGSTQGYENGYNTGKQDGLEQGRDEGYSNGYNTGHKEGLQDGLEQGREEGYNEGYDTGKQEGITQGEAQGRVEGYNDGKQDGIQEGYNTGYDEGHKDGVNLGQSTQLSNPVNFMLKPVSDFLNIKLFGVVSLGTIFNIVMFVFVATIFIKMFAGG